MKHVWFWLFVLNLFTGIYIVITSRSITEAGFFIAGAALNYVFYHEEDKHHG